MVPQYIRESDNKPAKMFREDFYTAASDLEIGISEILRERKPEDKDTEITVRMVKNKMHELLYNEGMNAFKVRKATAEGKRICQEMFPEFYGEMKELPVKKSAPKKEEDEKPAKAAKKETQKADTKKEPAKPVAAAAAKKGATAPESAATTGTGK